MDEMKENIERGAVYDIVFGQFCACSDETEAALNRIIEEIRALPNADVVKKETVRQAFAEACQECRDACEEFDGFHADCNQCLLHGVKEKLKSVLEVAEQ